MISTEFYISPTGKEVVVKELDSLDVKSRAKVLRTIQLVQHYGLSSLLPQVRKIQSTSLWELRVLGKNNVRVICCKKKIRTIVIVLVYVKKSQKTPTRILREAVRRSKLLDF